MGSNRKSSIDSSKKFNGARIMNEEDFKGVVNKLDSYIHINIEGRMSKLLSPSLKSYTHSKLYLRVQSPIDTINPIFVSDNLRDS